MKDLAKKLIEAIRYKVCLNLESLSFSLSIEEQKAIFELSNFHDLAHIVGASLDENGLLTDDEVRKKFNKKVFQALSRYEKICYDVKRVTQSFEQEKIPFIILKGSVIRELYHEPWLRNSSDIDILVKDEDIERATAVLVEKQNYFRKQRCSHEIYFFSQGNELLELHFSLLEDASYEVQAKVLETAWENVVPYNELKFGKKMNDEMEFFYHVAHMAKHFVGGGCGIRPFLDLWVLNKNKENAEKRLSLLEKGGLKDFYLACEELSNVWFEGREHSELSLKMENYILSGGTYGTISNSAEMKSAKNGGKKYFFARLFPKRQVLVGQYPVLKKHGYLLPIFWIVRFFKMIFSGRGKKALKEASAINNLSNEKLKQNQEFLNELGLY